MKQQILEAKLKEIEALVNMGLYQGAPISALFDIKRLLSS